MEVLDFSTDILAIKCVKNFVFIGTGCTLCILNTNDSKIMFKKDIIHPDNIHNIYIKDNKKVIIYGGRKLCTLQIEIKDNHLIIESVSDIHIFNDWIIDVNWLGNLNDPIVTILFAHNNVFNYNMVQKNYARTTCKETCLLYSGLIEANSESALIFSGTVFQEILIWKINKYSNSQFSDILYRLNGHKGVILSIFYSKLDNFICTSSDDRTVRLWKVSDDFFSNKKIEISLKITMYGHSARVLKTALFKNIITSIGEDSCICFWNFSGNLLYKINAHHGAPIWCIDKSDENFMYTGGADGAINCWTLPNTNIKNFASFKSKKIIPKRAIFIEEDNIIVLIHAAGKSKLFHFLYHNSKAKNIYDLHKHSVYYIMELSPNENHIALASIQGEISIYRNFNNVLTQLGTHKTLGSRIFSLLWLQCDQILICLDNGVLCILTVGQNDIAIIARRILPYSRERWITAGCLHNNFLICGDRMGSIHLFNLEDNSINPLQSLNKVHSRLGVQFCKILHSNLFTAGRDGTLKKYKFNITNDVIMCVDLLNSKIMPMDWICQILEYQDDKIVLGFKEENFLICSLKLKRILVKFPCGGGHRSWDCIINDDIIKFVYIQKQQINLISAPLKTLFLPQLSTGLCTKEIYCVQELPDVSENYHLIISGGEDSTLRINYINLSRLQPKILSLSSYDGHISNIKCLSIFSFPLKKNLKKYILFSGGGRAQIKVWELSIANDLETIHDKDIYCKDLISHMLYGLDQKRSNTWENKEFKHHTYLETRYMDISSIKNPLDPNNIFVFTAGSDGFLRIFNYNFSSNEINLVNETAYKNRCILKIHSFLNREKIILMTMATDGNITFWMVSVNHHLLELKTLETNNSLHLHKSGINSYDLKLIGDNHYLLATGGDDSFLQLTSFRIIMNENQIQSVYVTSRCSSSAHSAQITGLLLTANRKLYSVSADERILVHTYSYDHSTIALRLLKEENLCIPHIQGVILLKNIKIDVEEVYVRCRSMKKITAISETDYGAEIDDLDKLCVVIEAYGSKYVSIVPYVHTFS